MKKRILLTGLFVLMGMILACRLQFQNNAVPLAEESQEEISDKIIAFTPAVIAPDADRPSSISILPAEKTLNPTDLQYTGAFRLPDDSGGLGWDYSGNGMTYYPKGDPYGEADGFPGSLFVVGHDHKLEVAEISIPAPVISKNLADLNFARTIQPFADITGGLITEGLDLPVMGIEYLPAQGNLIGDKLHFAIGQHFQVFEPSHGWASLNLGDPNPTGLWVFDGFTNYATSDYLFEIPQDWADAYVDGFTLASGRFREGVWSGFGPALFACAPWLDGNPSPPGSTLTAVQPLLLYGTQIQGEPDLHTDALQQMSGYAEADHWWGGAWLTSDEGDAVIFTGTKALGESWYGFANGVVWDYDCADNPAVDCPEVPDFPYENRGYWAENYIPAMLFFNPDDLARVALGEWSPSDPQPYALLDLSTYWFDPIVRLEIYKRDLAGAAAFDRANGILYVVERLADDTKSVIHVFEIAGK